MSLLAIIDYSLIVIFFICITSLLLLGTRSGQRQAAASVILPSLHESPGTYIFLAALFVLLIILTALTRRRGGQNGVFG